MNEIRRENIDAILEDLDRRGVRYKLVADGTFKFSLTAPPMTEDLREALDTIRPGLTDHLRRRLGRCLDCGVNQATRPKHRDRTERAWLCEGCFEDRTRPVTDRINRDNDRRKRKTNDATGTEGDAEAERAEDPAFALEAG